MKDDQDNGTYSKVFHSDGVRTSITDKTFEVSVLSTGEIWEQALVKHLREWCKWRRKNEKLQEELGGFK
jgi:hypothetical protein